MISTTVAVVEDTDGRSRRWQAHRAERRAALCRLARKAVHRGGPDLSMDEMAAAMGTSKSIVYRYFTDKSGLQAAVGQEVVDEIAESLAAVARQQGSVEHRMRAMVQTYVGTLSTSPNVYRFVTAAPQGVAMSTFLGEVTAAVEVPLREILGPADPDGTAAALWAAGIVGFVRGAGDLWLQSLPEHRLDATVLSDLMAGWLWRGARSHLTRTGAN